MDLGMEQKLRILKLYKNKMRPSAIAQRFGISSGSVGGICSRYKGLPEKIMPGSLLAAGLEYQAVLWISRLIGVENPMEKDLKAWLAADPANAYRLCKKSKHGVDVMKFAIKKLGADPTLADLGLSKSGIRLAGWLTGKEYPHKSDAAKWFTDHPDKDERERIIIDMRKHKGLKGTGEKDVLELEILARNHMCGGD